MGSQKKIANTIEKTDDKSFKVITSDTEELKYSKAYRIKGVTRSIVVDALKVMDDMWEDCQESPQLMENYYQLRHYLSYLKRFCEGKV
ncbi:hypothetical protein GF312_07415 [Candidatus Poribacteria bacterium]|nr:hypothetical protein [Candidatus Poribacteria bacterium]